ncbi:MAG: iron export ABC transporter permease subunit FetB [Cyanobacteriota bacterium]|nr:iron export ABC transporter permease subunit FetB [Cyanobacteriota bacterium]
MDTLIQLDFLDLGIALGMMAIAIGISAWQQLGLEGNLALATARTVVQLVVVGMLVLEVIFTWENPLALAGLLAIMLSIAAIVARNRISTKIPKLLPLVWFSILVSSGLTLLYTNFLVLRQPDIWGNPQYLIPLAGIVMGNAMNGAALAGERFVSSIQASPLEIETHLCLGATPKQAISQYRKDAVRSGLIPTINSMMVVGLVTLPGIMTGQMLSGINPIYAAAYQILIMFMLAFANLIATLLITQGLANKFFNSAAQLERF